MHKFQLKVDKMIGYGKQSINDDDIQKVVDVLKSDFLTQGPLVPKFEDTICDKVGANHAIAMNSATSALHAACRALGLSQGGILWTSPITFAASANCGLYCGARVEFVDIDPNTNNMCIESLRTKLINAKVHDCVPDVLVVVHLGGLPCDMESIRQLSSDYGFKVIEDASHAVGSKLNGNFIGSCEYSDITIFSFHPVKIVTTGEGGMALTNSSRLADLLRLFRSHGISRDKRIMLNCNEGPWYYEQLELGYNYRMSDIHAALGENQFKRLEEFTSKRNELAARYDEKLSSFQISLPPRRENSYSSFHLYVIKIKCDRINSRKKDFFENMVKKGIGVNLHYIPVFLLPYYQKLGYDRSEYPNAIEYYREAMTLPLFPDLTYEEQDRVILALRETFEKFGRGRF